MPKTRVAPRVMIDLLYAEGVRWAGWYNPVNLERAFNRVHGRFMSDGFGPSKPAMLWTS